MNNNLTELIVILDASGSMAKRKQDVIGGFNQLLEDQRKQPGDCVVTVVQFSSFGRQRTIVDRKAVQDVAYLTDDSYRIGGWTALRDAMGSVIDDVGTRLANTPEDERSGKVIVAIITDGEENDSREYTADQIHEKVTHQQDVYSWQFLFTSASQDAVLESRKLGISGDLSAVYQPTAQGYGAAFRGLSYATSALRQDDCKVASACMKGIEAAPAGAAS